MIKKFDYVKIGAELKKFRENNGMTLHDVAGKIGVVDNTIYKYEHGLVPMTVDKLKKLAKVLKFGLEDIFGETSFDDKSLTIGQRVRTKRRALGLSKLELANILGYRTESSIKNIEDDRYDIPGKRMEDFCEVLDLGLADLIIGSKSKPKKQYHFNKSYPPEDFSNKGVEEMNNSIINKELNAILHVNSDNYTVDLEFVDKSKSDVNSTEYIRYGSRLHIGILAEEDLHKPHGKDCTCRICSTLQKYSIACDNIGVQIRDIVSHYLKVLKDNDIQSLTTRKALVITEAYKDIITITVGGKDKINNINITSKENSSNYYSGNMMSAGEICNRINNMYGYRVDSYADDVSKFMSTVMSNFINKTDNYDYIISMTLNIK
jgi:DNA-binding helix-turn-helix protein